MMTNDEAAIRWADIVINAYCRKRGIRRDDPNHADDIERIGAQAIEEFWSDLLSGR